MPFYYDGLCADHLRTHLSCVNQNGGVESPVGFFQQKKETRHLKYTTNGWNPIKGGVKGDSNLDVWLKIHADIDTLFLFFLLFVICFWKLFQVDLLCFLPQKSMSFLEIFLREKWFKVLGHTPKNGR